MSNDRISQPCGELGTVSEEAFCRQRRDGLRDAIKKAVSPRERPWPPGPSDPSMPQKSFNQALEAAAAQGVRGWAVVFSHDHYLTISGGAQNCINDEEAAFRSAGWAYLHFCPARPLPMLSDPLAPTELRLVISLNGERLGIVSMADVAAAFALLGLDRRRPAFIIHQLLGHVPELIADLVGRCPGAPVFFWAHDLFALCPSVHLLRNDAVFCGAPPIGSGACGICSAGEERPVHYARMRAFLEATAPTLLAPSETIRDMWRRHMDFSGLSHVVPPCRVEFGSAVAPPQGRPLRVGFLGTNWYAKGWTVFDSLSRWHQGDSRYEFFQLGRENPGIPYITHIPAEVTRRDRHAMVEAVREADLDVAINWSLYYESFNFTAIEALAGGAFVIARKGGGNVWPLVSAAGPGRGVAVETEVELQAMFIDGGIGRLVAQSDRRRGRLILGSGTAGILLREAADA